MKHLLLPLCLTAAFTACESDDVIRLTEGFDEKTYTQQDRIARPAVTTLFIHTNGDPTFPAANDIQKNRYNTGVPSEDQANWRSTIRASLAAFRSLDDVPSNDSGQANGEDIDVYADVLSTDVLLMDLSETGSSTFLGVELGVEDSTGGRALTDDVVDAALSVVLFPDAADAFTSDNVDANDAEFLGTFPYLSPANP